MQLISLKLKYTCVLTSMCRGTRESASKSDIEEKKNVE